LGTHALGQFVFGVIIRKIRPFIHTEIAKATLFLNPVVSILLRSLGTVPVLRKADKDINPQMMKNNEKMKRVFIILFLFSNKNSADISNFLGGTHFDGFP
jgi:hypothetical protein